MYRMGIIAESLNHQELLNQWSAFIVNQRTEKVEEETASWHVYELHLSEPEMLHALELLVNDIKETWYIHAFNEFDLYVIMKGKYFRLPQQKDESWNEMIEYGTKIAKVEKSYLDSISCDI